MNVIRNNVVRSRNHCCHRHAITCPPVPVTYTSVNNIINYESVAMEAQQCVLFIVALHTSLPTLRNTLKYARKVQDIFVRNRFHSHQNEIS